MPFVAFLFTSREDLAEEADCVDVGLRRGESGAHGIDGNVRCSQGEPCLDAFVPFVLVEPLNADPGIDAESFPVAAGFFQILVQLLDVGFNNVVGRSARRHPAISESGGAPECRLGAAAEPDWDRTLNGHWIDAGIVNDEARAAMCDQRLCPELSQHFDLLCDAAPTGLEFFSERVVLYIIPAQADAKTQ